MNKQIEDNKTIFMEYNIGDKLMITDGDDEVHFGVIQNFGYNDHGDMTLWVDMVGRREIRSYNPRSAVQRIEVLK